MAEFDNWAVYYDIIHQGLPGEAEFYIGHALRTAGPILELGCGTGRICIPMAMSGAAVTGMDISSGMLEICREKMAAAAPLSGPLEVLQGDMRDFSLDTTFQAIYLPYRTFMHLLTPQDQIACLRCVHRHLKSDGVVILNLWAARPSSIAAALNDPSLERFQLVGEHYLPDEALSLLHFYTAKYDEYRQWIIEEHRIQEKDEQGELLHNEALSLTRAWLTPREMEHLVRYCGFEVEALLGDFDANAFGPESKEMIWVLRKAS